MELFQEVVLWWDGLHMRLLFIFCIAVEHFAIFFDLLLSNIAHLLSDAEIYNIKIKFALANCLYFSYHHRKHSHKCLINQK